MSLKNDLISLNLGVLEQNCLWNCFINSNTVSFFYLPPTSSHHHPLQVKNCNCDSQLVVDKDYNGKLRLEIVKNRFHLKVSVSVARQNV